MQFSKTILTSLVLVAGLALAQGIALKPQESTAVGGSNTGVIDGSNGFAVQSGYEGYLLSPPLKGTELGAAGLLVSKIGLLKNVLVPLGSFALSYGAKALKVLAHVGLVLLAGLAAAYGLCSFTPICGSVDIGKHGLDFIKGKLVKEQVQELARTYMTPENMEFASKLVQSAFDKYRRPGHLSQVNIQDNETTSL